MTDPKSTPKSTPTFTLRKRARVLVNTDPQRRCYNGCHFSSELQWTPWVTFDSCVPADKVESQLKFWRELNDYAVSCRGETARAEFEMIPNQEPENENQN
jgi:hypothetical protein